MTRVPEISVVMPTYNRRTVVVAALDAYRRQTMEPARFEIVVSDDGSTDGTGAAIAAARQQLPFAVQYEWGSNAGPGAARNRALRKARGRLIVITNDDTIPAIDFLEKHVAAHQENPDYSTAILGRVTVAPEIPPSVFAQLHLDSIYALLKGQRALHWSFFLTCNVSFKGHFFRACGEWFDEQLRWHEDRELGERLSRHGMTLLYRPEILGYHLHHLTERDYMGRAEMDGVELVRWFRKSPHLEPELRRFGLFGPHPLTRDPRHRLGDVLLNDMAFPVVHSVARRLARLSPGGAAALYRRLYRRRMRGGIARALSSDAV